MIKKILLIGLDTEKGKKAFDFFINYPEKYKISDVCLVSNEISEEDIKKITENNIKNICVKTETQKKQLEEAVPFNINVCIKPNFFVKQSISDIVVFTIDDIDSITQILTAINEYKDLCFFDLTPLLYCGKIIFQEIRNKAIRFFIISETIYSVNQTLLNNKNSTFKKIGLVRTIYNKEYLKKPTQKTFNEFKELFYNDFHINNVYDMFLLSYIYNFNKNRFVFGEQNKPIANNIISFYDGRNIIDYITKDNYSIFNNYFLEKKDISKKNLSKEETKTITNLSIDFIDYKEKPLLSLAIKALDKKGTAPILFFICVEHLIKKIYNKKMKIKDLEKTIEEVVFNQKYYIQHPDVAAIISLKEKIEADLDKKL